MKLEFETRAECDAVIRWFKSNISTGHIALTLTPYDPRWYTNPRNDKRWKVDVFLSRPDDRALFALRWS